MENSKLKENIRKKVKEKIAVSNIRKEFDMKTNNKSRIIYVTISACAMLVLCIGIGINYNNTISNRTEIGKNVKEEDSIIFNTESIKSTTSIAGEFKDFDGEWKDANITEMFSFIKDTEILKTYDNVRQGMVYVKENPKNIEYSKLQQYELIYYMNGDNAPSTNIIFTKEEEILGCMIPKEDVFFTSSISANKVKLFKVENFEDKNKIDGRAYFEYNGYNFYIESHKIDESDFISIIKDIVDQDK